MVDFPLVGEPLALDLVNTRLDGGVDLLATPAGLDAWLDVQAGRLGPRVRPSRADVGVVQALREHVATAIEHARAGRRPPAAALAALNRAMREAPAVPELDWTGSAVTATSRRSGSFGTRLAAQLAEAAGDLLASAAITSVRVCEADDCVLLFLPAHPRRRWCSASRCGNRARVARYYRRHKV